MVSFAVLLWTGKVMSISYCRSCYCLSLLCFPLPITDSRMINRLEGVPYILIPPDISWKGSRSMLGKIIPLSENFISCMLCVYEQLT